MLSVNGGGGGGGGGGLQSKTPLCSGPQWIHDQGCR